LRLSTVHSPRCASALVLSRHPAPPAIYPLSLHDALPICQGDFRLRLARLVQIQAHRNDGAAVPLDGADQLVDLLAVQQQLPVARSEEHTSELQSRENLVCRLLLEKKNNT